MFFTVGFLSMEEVTMKHRFALVSVLSVLALNTLFIASTHAAGPATSDGAAKAFQGLHTGTIQEPEEAHRLFVEAFNSGNLDALVALYEPEAYIQQREPAGQRLSSDSRSAFGIFVDEAAHYVDNEGRATQR
jgi:hypothetical protein